MKNKQLTLVVVSLLVVVLSVSLAYFTAQIIGKGKDVSVTSTNLQIVFTDTDGEIAGADIEPGWQKTKTFTVQNNSKSEYKYNIVIKDLLNTFVTEGYLQYKITSTNNGYNMTEFKDIPKSSVATDTILAYSVVIPNGVTQSYTIEFKYVNDESVDQSDDMGRKLSGTLFITEGTEEPITLLSQLLADKSTKLTRTDFSTVLTADNTNTLYTSTEDSKTVYYFAGNATDNWVKFGKNASNQDLYWRIIRTNSDGGVRLLYHGTRTTATNAVINSSTEFNKIITDPMYVGYMYGTSGSLVNNRTNTNNSTIKGVIDTWYQNNLNTNYGKYISTTAVYCNDRSNPAGGYNTGRLQFNYGAYTRLLTNKTPSYDCAATEDKFTVDSSTGNGKLTYPIALMTADEVSFAGGVIFTNAPTWYYKNSANESSTDSTWWLLLSPVFWSGGDAYVFGVGGSSYPGHLNTVRVTSSNGVRPALSLKACVKWKSGDGSASAPYTIKETTSGC